MLLSQEAGGIPVAELGQYGIAGVIGMIFLWFGWQVYKRERDRADKNEAEIARLNTVIQDRYIPSLEEATRVMASVKELLSRRRS